MSDLPRLGAPAQRALANAGITALAQLAQYREAGVRKLHSMGRKALHVLKEAFSAQGLGWQPD